MRHAFREGKREKISRAEAAENAEKRIHHTLRLRHGGTEEKRVLRELRREYRRNPRNNVCGGGRGEDGDYAELQGASGADGYS